MRIALIIVLGGDLVRSTEHVGIGYIASCLREGGFDIDILEISNTDHFEYEANRIANTYDIVGFTTTCITLSAVLLLVEKTKGYNPRIFTVLGGHMATFAGEVIVADFPQVDCVIYGEGELTFLDLAKSIKVGTCLSRIEGIIYRDGMNVIKNKERPLIEDLDSLPFPARDQFIQHNCNFQYLRVSTSRGCLGNCGFCSSFVGRKQDGPVWRGRSPKNVVDEIEELVNVYDFRTFDFVDSTFEDPGDNGKQRIRQIAQELIERRMNIYYNCCFRAENWKETDRDTLGLLVESGLEKVNIGFEAGNDRGLKILNKRARSKDNWAAINVLSEFPDIYITFGFIMLHPYSTLQDIWDNGKFLYSTGIGQVIRHYFWQLEVYPDTLIETKLKQDNLLKKNYDVSDGMYKYRFQNEEVSFLVPIFQALLTVDAVWDFEILDIIIHTFISRNRRQLKGTALYHYIESFDRYVSVERKEISDFNYRFFCSILSQGVQFDIEEGKSVLKQYLERKMNQIVSMEYKIGRDILKNGGSLVQR